MVRSRKSAKAAGSRFERVIADYFAGVLEDERVDPSDASNYAIRHSVANRHVEVVKMLLQDARVDPTAEDNYAFKTAVANNYPEIIQLLRQDFRVNSLAVHSFI